MTLYYSERVAPAPRGKDTLCEHPQVFIADSETFSIYTNIYTMIHIIQYQLYKPDFSCGRRFIRAQLVPTPCVIVLRSQIVMLMSFTN